MGNHLLPSFSASSSFLYPCSIPLWESQESLSSLSWPLKVLRFGTFLKFNSLQFCYSVFQWQISSTEIYLSLLLITCSPKSFWIYFIYQRLHVDGKLQITLVYYLQGIIQKILVSGSGVLPPIIFDKRVPFFKKYCYFKVFLGKTPKMSFFKDPGRCPKILDYTLISNIKEALVTAKLSDL